MPQPIAKPNFIVILIDDMGYGDIGPFGSKLNRTPNLDRMAKDGLKLTSFYCAPLCTASRTQLMTGCYSKRLSMPDVLFPASATGLSHEEKTDRRAPQTAGLYDDVHREMAPRRPAGVFADATRLRSLRRAALFQRYGWQQGAAAAAALGGCNGRGSAAVQHKLTALYTDVAVKFITANKDHPFFLYLPHTAVHAPHNPGLQFRGKSANGIYGDWVEEVDWSVGRVLDKVKELKLDKNTLVLFTSDNGGTPVASNAPLRGFKGSTWEGGIREPTIAWWPGKIAAGSTCDAMMSEIDVLPTLVRLAGGKIPADRKIDGLDIWPVLSGESKESPHDALYYFRRMGCMPCAPVRGS